jgi:TonB-linked SusC/RagA family outer membrane protein
MKIIEFEISPYLGKKLKLLLIMKLTFLLTVVCFLQTSATVYSQATKFSFEMKNQRIQDVLREIEKNSEFRFFYQREQVDVEQVVSLNITDKTVEEILPELFKGQEVVFDVRQDNLILIKPEKGFVDSSTEFYTQQNSVTGKVTDTGNQPLPGVTVLVIGTAQGTVTNADGNYTLSGIPENATLQFSFVGMNTQEIVVGNQTSINVTMELDAIGIEEVVAVGYGTQKRSDLIGSIASINKEGIVGRATLNVQQALQGKAAGVMVTNVNGQPGNTPTVRIRGIGTLNNNDPLYIVDGVPMTNNIDIINNNDIESIEILKDAASASIYGSQSGNGVILITTKKGTKGKPTVFYNANLGYNEASNRLDLLNAKEYTMISDEALVNAGLAPYWNGSTGRADTDWQDQIFQKGFIQSHTLGVRGSKEDVRYYLSAGYDDQDGTLIETDYKRYNIKSNVDVNVTEKLLVGMNLSYAYVNSTGIEQGINSVLINAVRMPPTVPAYNEDGTLGYPKGNEADGQNPIGYAQRSKSLNTSSRTFSNLFAEYKLLTDLKLRSSFGADMVNEDFSRFSPTFNEGNAKNEISALNESYTKSKNISFDFTINYNKVFNKRHSVSAMAGTSMITFDVKSTSASKKGFISNDENMRYFNAGTQQDQVSGNRNGWALLSYFGRLNYVFDNRYLFQFNIRADGSSRFGPNNKWGTFPSVAAGWRLSEEQFLKNVEWLSNLKLRASYGVLGTMPTAYYGFTSTLAQTKYILGANQSVVIGYHPSSINNNDFKWETTYQTNIGLDAGIWKNKLTFTFEYFNKYTKDILQILPMPGIAGTSGSLTNIGEMKNTGLEFSGSLNDQVGDLKYSISGNVGTLKNEVLKLFDNDAPITSGYSRTEVGRSIGELYGYVTDGIFQNQAEIDAYKMQPLAKPGDVKFKDIDKDGSLTSKDMDFLGSPIPSLTYGLNIDLEYKEFDFSMSLVGVAGNYIYYSGNTYLINGGNNFNKSKSILNRWQKDGDMTKIPRVSVKNSNDNFRQSDLFVESGAYTRLGNIQLGYSVSPELTKKVGLQSLRIYFSANNLFTITKYSGYDPEINISNALNAGNDQITYPVPRTILFGINVTL